MDSLNKKYPLLDSMKIKTSTLLDKNIFKASNIHVIGQANNQLIICLLIKERLMLVFDQHAVHERIRYEKLLSSAFNNHQLTTQPVIPPFEIIMPLDLCQKLETIKCQLEQYLGMKINIKNGSLIVISQIPCCFKSFNHSGLLQDFFLDALNFFMSKDKKINENHNRMTPFLLEQIRSQACRGAIRFNEHLSYQECMEMIKALTNCKFCFRCAHGRVLVKPMLYIPNKNRKQINFEETLQKVLVKKFPTIITQFKKKILNAKGEKNN